MATKPKEYTSDPQMRKKLQGHRAPVVTLAFHRNMRQVASGSEDACVQVWNFKQDSRPFRFARHRGAVTEIAISPVSELLASASRDETVRLWQNSIEGEAKTIKVHSAAVRSVSFSGDGNLLITGADDKSMKIWRVEDQKFQTSLNGHANWVLSCRFNPTSDLVASSSSDKTVKLWDVSTRTALVTFSDHSDIVPAVRFTPDGQCIASCSHDRKVKLWDIRSNSLVQHYDAHADAVLGLSIDAAGGYMATVSRDSTIKLWDIRQGHLLYTLYGHEQGTTAVEWSPDGSILATGGVDGNVLLWDANLGTVKSQEVAFPTSPMSANYDANSHYQMESNLKNLDDLVEALKVFRADKTITMADIGCATGLTSMQLFHKAFLRLKEDTDSQVLVHHVDVPTNEWGVLFRNYWSDQETYRTVGNAFISAIGGTMYTRLFPDNYLNVVYSAFTLHWLSKKIMSPPNATEEDIRQLAAVQAKLDIELFLSLRLQELKPMGRMVLRTASTIAFTAPIVICINQMKADGHLPPTLSLCSYNVVSYHSLEEHLEVILKFQGKLKIVTAKADRVLHPLWGPGTENESAETLAERRMMGLRAASETSFQYFLKEYNLDVIGLSSMLFRYVRDYYFNHPEPVYLDEVYFVLEKLPTA